MPGFRSHSIATISYVIHPTDQNMQLSHEKKKDDRGAVERFKPIAKWAIAFIVLVFLFLTIQKAYADVMLHREHLDFSALDWRWMIAGVFAYAVGMFPAAIAWLQTLSGFGQNVPLRAGFHAYFLGHLGKYVPGKAMVIVMRVARLAPLGIEIKPTVVAIFVETLTSIAVGAVLGCVFLFFLPEFPPSWMIAGAAVCIPCSIVLLLPHTFRAILAVLAKSKIGRMPRSVSEAFTWKMMIRTCLWMAIGWLIHGTAGWLVSSIELRQRRGRRQGMMTTPILPPKSSRTCAKPRGARQVPPFTRIEIRCAPDGNANWCTNTSPRRAIRMGCQSS